MICPHDTDPETCVWCLRQEIAESRKVNEMLANQATCLHLEGLDYLSRAMKAEAKLEESTTTDNTPVEWCRRCRDQNRSRHADVVVWGKLFDASLVGPRCMDCLYEQYPSFRGNLSQYEILDLRPLVRRTSVHD